MPPAESAGGPVPPPSRVVIAPDSFKGSIRAHGVAESLSRGWRSVRPQDEIVVVPMADGGEGTAEAFASAYPDARTMPVTVSGPYAEPVTTSWLLLPSTRTQPETAVVELARTSGIELIPEGVALRPLDASTAGFGEAIRAAINHGVERLILAIGSSASSDGGAGMLEALGARLLDEAGERVPRGARGLSAIRSVARSGMLAPPPQGAIVLADVDSPLLGDRGAARVFAPQKGATPADEDVIEKGLAHWAALLGGDPDAPGAGAAGGLGFGLMAWGAQLRAGAETIASLLGLERTVRPADFLITGEGSFDEQSAAGKAPAVALALARRYRVPAALVAGRILYRPADLADACALVDLAPSPQDAIAHPEPWLIAAGERLARNFSAAGKAAR